jgi:hypothetical protein
MISGLGGRGGSLSSRSVGRQRGSDRCGSSDSLIRAIAGSDIGTWLDANDITGVADGGAVASWTAKAGNSTDTQGNTDKRPTLDVDGLNGRPAVKFDNTDDALVWGNGNLFSAKQAENTVLATAETATTSGAAMILELGDPNFWQAGEDGIALYFENKKFGVGLGNGVDSHELSTKQAAPAAAVVAAVFNRTPNPDRTEGYISGDRVVASSSTYGNSTVETDWVNEPTSLGSRADGGASRFNGVIREVIVLKRAITAGEVFRLSKAMMAKSGITTPRTGYPQ